MVKMVIPALSKPVVQHEPIVFDALMRSKSCANSIRARRKHYPLTAEYMNAMTNTIVEQKKICNSRASPYMLHKLGVGGVIAK